MKQSEIDQILIDAHNRREKDMYFAYYQKDIQTVDMHISGIKTDNQFNRILASNFDHSKIIVPIPNGKLIDAINELLKILYIEHYTFDSVTFSSTFDVELWDDYNESAHKGRALLEKTLLKKDQETTQ